MGAKMKRTGKESRSEVEIESGMRLPGTRQKPITCQQGASCAIMSQLRLFLVDCSWRMQYCAAHVH